MQKKLRRLCHQETTAALRRTTPPHDQPRIPLTVDRLSAPFLEKVTEYCFFSPAEKVSVVGSAVTETPASPVGSSAVQVVSEGPRLVSVRVTRRVKFPAELRDIRNEG